MEQLQEIVISYPLLSIQTVNEVWPGVNTHKFLAKLVKEIALLMTVSFHDPKSLKCVGFYDSRISNDHFQACFIPYTTS